MDKHNFTYEFMKVLKNSPDFNKVKFVFLFGSHPQGRETPLSDVDFAVFYDGDKKERFKFRLKTLTKLSDKFDVQIFQDLPLYVRMEVLKGRLIYAKDIPLVYETAYNTIQAFDDFKKYYYEYINLKKMLQ